MYRTSGLTTGKEGNQYFISTIEMMTTHDERIDKLFITKEKNQIGIYHLKLFVNGLRTSIVIDDFVPCNPETGKPAFIYSTFQEIWAILLEKAWAKLHGSY